MIRNSDDRNHCIQIIDDFFVNCCCSCQPDGARAIEKWEALKQYLNQGKGCVSCIDVLSPDFQPGQDPEETQP